MLRSKDFYLKNIYDVNGKKIGVVEDIYIDFYNQRVVGFKCSSLSFLNKNDYIDIEDVIELDDEVVVYSRKQGSGLSFKSIKNLNIVDINGIKKGVLEDIIVDSNNYNIKGIIASSGIFDRLIKGKEIFLLEQCILGDEYILYTGKDNIEFKTMIHDMEKKNDSAKA